MSNTNFEENRCCFFSKCMEENYPQRLYSYKNPEAFYPDDSFENETAGAGNTEVFRRFITEYIRDFSPEALIEGKPYTLTLMKDGRFIVINDNTGKEEHFLGTTEKLIYHYLCFIHTARFWQEFEIMRDIHHVSGPLIIQDFVGCLDESVNIDSLLKKAEDLGRKVIIII